MIRSFRKIRSETEDLVQVQENIEQTFSSLLRVPQLNGVLLRDISLQSGQNNRIEHKLGRSVIGYTVIRKDAPATIYDTKSSKVSDQNILLLNTDLNTTIDIWIF